MNHYTFDQIALGQKEIFSVVITAEMMQNFYTITSDSNPLHMDESFAKMAGYAGKVAYGMLTASFLSTLAGVYLPGEKSVIHAIDVKFPIPVYIGNTLTFYGEVVRKDSTYKVIELRISAVNTDGKKVLRGKMKIGVLA